METQEIIEEIITKYSGITGFRETPVRNFLGSLPSDSNKIHAKLNLNMDAKSYSWKPAIINAIEEGIDKIIK